ncbi:MAG: hypothetical protein ACR2NP_08340 [Pirellulaceae bacterium]
MIRFLACVSVMSVNAWMAGATVAQVESDQHEAAEPVSDEVLEQERLIKIAIKEAGGEVTEENGVVISIRLGRQELLDSMKDSAELIRSVRDLSRLRRLALYHNWAQDEILKEVTHLVQLEQLVLWDFDPRLTNAGIAQVKDMPNLDYLYITNINGFRHSEPAAPAVTGEVLQTLGQMDQLTQLFLTTVPTSDEHLEYLSDMTQLDTLQLGVGSSDITPEGLSHLSGLTNLRRFGVQQANLNDETFDHLAFLTGIEDLMLTNADSENVFGDAAYDYLLDHEHITRVYIGPTTFSIDQMRRLLESREFERFMVQSNAVQAEQIKALLEEYPGRKIWINNISHEDR